MVRESKRKANNKWDAENMKNVVCKMRRDIAEDFMEQCRSNGTTANKVVHDCILQYLSQMEMRERSGSHEQQPSRIPPASDAE